MPIINRKRRGKFCISGAFMDDSMRTGDADALLQLMGMVVITRAEYLYLKDVFEYIAVSEYFDEIDDGAEIPEYNVIVHSGSICKCCVEFERRK